MKIRKGEKNKIKELFINKTMMVYFLERGG